MSFDVSAHLGGKVSAASDRLEDVVSYDLLVEAIDAALAEKRYNLLEALAEAIAARVLALPNIIKTRVTISKLERVEGAIGVSIERTRQELRLEL